jgi:hypothetical protein
LDGQAVRLLGLLLVGSSFDYCEFLVFASSAGYGTFDFNGSASQQSYSSEKTKTSEESILGANFARTYANCVPTIYSKRKNQ